MTREFVSEFVSEFVGDVVRECTHESRELTHNVMTHDGISYECMRMRI